MRKNKLLRRVVPALLSLALVFNTGFTLSGMNQWRNTGSRGDAEPPVDIVFIEDGSTEDESEEVAEEAAESSTEEQDDADGFVPDWAVDLPYEVIEHADGTVSIYGDIGGVFNGGPLPEGDGSVVLMNPFDFPGDDDWLHPIVGDVNNGQPIDSVQIMYYHVGDTYVPVFCVEPGVALHTDDKPESGGKRRLDVDTEFGELNAEDRRCLKRVFAYSATFNQYVTKTTDYGTKTKALSEYWVYQSLIWHYIAGMSDGQAKNCIGAFLGQTGNAYIEMYDRIKSEVESYDTIPSYSVKTAGKLDNSVRYALRKVGENQYSTIIHDTTGMLSGGKMNTPSGLYSSDNAALANVTFTQCNADGTPNSSGEYLQITSTSELPLIDTGNGTKRNVIVKQTKKGGESETPTSNSVYFSNGSYLQDYVYTDVQKETIPCYFSLYTVDEEHLIIQKKSTLSFGEELGCYDFSGTTYGIYTSMDCTADSLAYGAVFAVDPSTGARYSDNRTVSPILTIDKDGKSPEVAITKGKQYYVREITAGKGFMLDDTIYHVKLDNPGTQVIISEEVPVSDPTAIKVYKTDKEGIELIKKGADGATVYEIGGATLEGAIFEISYNTDYVESQVPGTIIGSWNPNGDGVNRVSGNVATWYVKTIYDKSLKKCVAQLDSAHLVKSFKIGDTVYKSSPLYYNQQGNPTIPLGTVFISEVKPPKGFEDGVMTDKQGNAKNGVSIQQIRATMVSYPDGRKGADGAAAYVKSSTTKEYDELAGKNTYYVVPQSGSPLAVNEAIIRGDVRLKKVDYEKQSNMAGVFFKITSSAGEVHYIMTGADGTWNSKNVPNKTNTNFYDTLFDASGKYIGGNPSTYYNKTVGLWFYGTADKTQWDTNSIDESSGAFRYDETYTIEEMPGPNNTGKQLYKGTFAVTADTEIDLGNIYNVDYPSLDSEEYDRYYQDHVSICGNDFKVEIVDEVTYKKLKEKTKYTIKGILMEIDADGNIIGPLKDIDGNYIMSSKSFKTEAGTVIPYVDGGVYLDFDFYIKADPVKRFVVFDYCFEGTDTTPLTVDANGRIDSTGAVAVHDDPTDADQQGVIKMQAGDIKFTKVDYEKQSNMAGVFFKITNTETGEYHYIMTDENGEYDSSRVAHSKNTDGYDKYFDANGNYDGTKPSKLFGKEIGLWFYGTADKSKWKASDVDDNRGVFLLGIEYEIEEMRGPNNEGKQLEKVTFTLSDTGVTDIGTIENVDKPSITSKEYDADTKTHETLAGKGTEIHVFDTVYYKKLLASTEYTVKGILMAVDEKGGVTPLKDADGNIITAVKTFTTDASATQRRYVDGETELEFKATVSVSQSQKFVVFDYLYEGKSNTPVRVNADGTVDSTGALAVHDDPADENQTGILKLRAKVKVFKTGPFIVGTDDFNVKLPTNETVTVKRLKFEQKAFAGIEFTVYNAATDEAVTKFVTNAKGEAVSDYINYDADNTKYYVMETRTPAGLVQDTTRYDIDFSEYDSEDVAFMNKPINIINQVNSAEINVYKQGDFIIPNTKDSFGVARKGIAGVYFGVFTAEDIKDAEGNVVVKADTLVGINKTDEEGKASIREALVAGKYYYQELCTESNEYVLDKTRFDFEIKYKENNTDEVVSFEVNAENPLYNTYKSQDVQIHKVDENGNSLSGVEFALYRLYKDEYIQIGHYETDVNGMVIIKNVPYGKYYFLETKGIAGYEFDGETHHEFEINDETIGTGKTIEVTAVNRKKSETPGPKTGDMGTPFLALLAMMFIAVLLGSINAFSVYGMLRRSETVEQEKAFKKLLAAATFGVALPLASVMFLLLTYNMMFGFILAALSVVVSLAIFIVQMIVSRKTV